MALQDIDLHATSPADPASVWRLLGDSPTWPTWTPVRVFALERAGGADGVGEIRSFTTGRIRIREEIVERVPEQRLVYVLLSGIAVRDYRAEIDLTPQPDGTEIRWHTTFRAAVPGTGWLYRRALAKATRQFVDGLAAHAAASPAGAA